MNIQYHYNIRNEVVASAQGSTTEHATYFSNHKSLKTRIKQVATVSLIFLSMVTGEVCEVDTISFFRYLLQKNKDKSCYSSLQQDLGGN